MQTPKLLSPTQYEVLPSVQSINNSKNCRHFLVCTDSYHLLLTTWKTLFSQVFFSQICNFVTEYYPCIKNYNTTMAPIHIVIIWNFLVCKRKNCIKARISLVYVNPNNKTQSDELSENITHCCSLLFWFHSLHNCISSHSKTKLTIPGE